MNQRKLPQQGGARKFNRAAETNNIILFRPATTGPPCPVCQGNRKIEARPGVFINCPRCNPSAA